MFEFLFKFIAIYFKLLESIENKKLIIRKIKVILLSYFKEFDWIFFILFELVC